MPRHRVGSGSLDAQFPGFSASTAVGAGAVDVDVSLTGSTPVRALLTCNGSRTSATLTGAGHLALVTRAGRCTLSLEELRPAAAVLAYEYVWSYLPEAGGAAGGGNG